MSYVKKQLTRGEEIVYETRQHWFAVIARTWLGIVVAILGLAVLLWVGTAERPIGGATADLVLTLAGWAALVMGLAWVAFVVWDWRNQEWLVTSRRIIRAEGILNKQVAGSSLEKINDARLVQSWVGRIFNYGTLDILTAAEEAGGNNVDDFPMVADPVQFKMAMLNQKEVVERPDLAPPRYQRQPPAPEYRRPEPMPPRAGSDRVSQVAAGDGAPRSDMAAPSAAEPAAPRPRSSADELAETLEKLAGLRDRGFITAEEYEAKKRELLERM